jgi:hypothetical protein
MYSHPGRRGRRYGEVGPADDLVEREIPGGDAFQRAPGGRDEASYPQSGEDRVGIAMPYSCARIPCFGPGALRTANGLISMLVDVGDRAVPQNANQKGVSCDAWSSESLQRSPTKGSDPAGKSPPLENVAALLAGTRDAGAPPMLDD